MTVFTEKQHQAEFLVSEGRGTISRESGTLKAGEVVVDGTVLALSATKLVAATGASGEDVVGISYGDHDATAGDVVGVPYIARLAEVQESKVHASAASGSTIDWAALAALFIIRRQ